MLFMIDGSLYTMSLSAGKVTKYITINICTHSTVEKIKQQYQPVTETL